MTNYELEDLLNSTTTAGLEAFGMYMTLLVAYLVASYLAGSRLTSAQALTLSILFLAGSVIFTLGTFAYMGRAIVIVDKLELLNPDIAYASQPAFRNAIAILQVLGIVACFKFKWDIRRAKEE